MITQYIEDIIGDIVTATGLVLSKNINYLYGHPLEIIDDLVAISSDPEGEAVKYPLIALFTDFPEDRGKDGIESDATLNIIIATVTENGFTTKQRTANTFKPILFPIYKEFLNQVVLSRLFTANNEDLIPHRMWKRYYWGRTGLYGKEGNLFRDYIDAIELENFQLKLKSVIC